MAITGTEKQSFLRTIFRRSVNAPQKVAKPALHESFDNFVKGVSTDIFQSNNSAADNSGKVLKFSEWLKYAINDIAHGRMPVLVKPGAEEIKDLGSFARKYEAGKPSVITKILGAPIMAFSRIWHGLRDGVSFKTGKSAAESGGNILSNAAQSYAKTRINLQTEGKALTVAQKELIERAGKLPVLGTAIVLGYCIIPKVIDAGKALIKGDFDKASTELARAGITSALAAAAGIGLTATGAGAAASGVGAAAGAWVGNSICNKLFKSQSENNEITEGGINEAGAGQHELKGFKSPQEVNSVIAQGFPLAGPMNDEKFNRLINYVSAVGC